MNNRDIDQFYQDLRDDTIQYSRTERYVALKTVYWRNARMIAETVNPLWDLKRSSLIWNLGASTSEVQSCQLIERVRFAEILEKIESPEEYRFPLNWNVLNSDKAIRVVDRWLQEVPLTPPVIECRADGTWEKRDGYHRLAIAMMCGPLEMPVWLLNSVDSVYDEEIAQ